MSSGLLSIARTALLTHQSALQTISQNIANAETPGYSRQEALLVANTPVAMPSAAKAREGWKRSMRLAVSKSGQSGVAPQERPSSAQPLQSLSRPSQSSTELVTARLQVPHCGASRLVQT